MINTRVKMSDRREIGMQLFLLMASHGNHVTAAIFCFFITHSYLNLSTRKVHLTFEEPNSLCPFYPINFLQNLTRFIVMYILKLL